MSRWSGKTCRLTTMMVLTSSFFLVEIIVGTLTNSIALVADSFHMLSDVVALIVGFASVRISKWKTKRNTYGWQRAEVLGALVNSVFLLALCFSIIIESVKRLVEVEEVESPAMLLIVGGLGLLVNVFGLFLFGGHGHSHGGGGQHGHGHSHGGGGHGHGHHGHSHSHGHDSHSHNNKRTNGTIRQDSGEGTKDVGVTEMASLDVTPEDEGGQKRLSSGQLSTTSTSTEREVIQVDNEAHTEVIKHSATSSSESLNMRGVFLHVLGDALGSVVVIISALAIWFVEGDWKYYLDPAMSILMVIIILSTTIPLFKESAYILLQTVPRHVDVDAITRELRGIDGIAGVHEVHIWQLAGRRIIASAHVHCKDILEYMVLANKIKNVFHKAGIHSTTIQPEFPVHPGDDLVSCSLRCSTDAGDKCDQDTCCGPATAVTGKRQDQYNNSNNSDSAHLLLRPSGAELEDGGDLHRNRQHWDIPMEMSPEGDEVVLDLSKAE